MITTIEFEDKGQDFLEWDIDENGKVIACRPFQEWVWVGVTLLNDPVIGEKLHFISNTNPQPLQTRYRVKHITPNEASHV